MSCKEHKPSRGGFVANAELAVESGVEGAIPGRIGLRLLLQRDEGIEPVRGGRVATARGQGGDLALDQPARLVELVHLGRPQRQEEG